MDSAPFVPPSTSSGTTSSFVHAVQHQLPLSSHGAGHVSLERGAACLTCRQRKVKCDGQKPVCGACVRSAKAAGDPSTAHETCNYEDQPKTKARKEKGSERAAALEAKIAELERLIEERTGGQPVASTSTSAPRQRPPPTITASKAYLDPTRQHNFGPNPNIYQVTGNESFDGFSALLQASSNSRPANLFPNLGQVDNQTSASSAAAFVQSLGGNTSLSASPSNAFGNLLDPINTPPLTNGISSPDSNSYLLDVFYPGWPVDLPSPSLVNRLVEIYFSKSHAAIDMINQRKFMANMSLPPMHANYPHKSLIHAILATTSKMVSESFWNGEDQYWKTAYGGFETPGDYHISRTKAAIDEAVEKGRSLFQVAQASVLVCYYMYTQARFVEVWLACGLATRIGTPLGLNHLRGVAAVDTTLPQGCDAVGSGAESAEDFAKRFKDDFIVDPKMDKGTFGTRPMDHVHKVTGKPAKPAIMPPVEDDEDLFERASTFWHAVACDRFASASSGWAMSLDEADITSLLPSRTAAPGPVDPHTHPLSIQSHSFFISHPTHLVGSLQLYLKSIILMGRVVSYLQKYTTRPQDTGEPEVDWRTTHEFKALDAEVVTFRLSLPREFQFIQGSPCKDSKVSLIHAVPHACTIILHEPFASTVDGDVSMLRCLMSARAILESVYSLWSSSFDIALLAPFINWCWTVAGRTFVRELAIKQSKGQWNETEQLKSDVKIMLTAMRSYRSPLGDRLADGLQALLDHPEACLPTSPVPNQQPQPQRPTQQTSSTSQSHVSSFSTTSTGTTPSSSDSTSNIAAAGLTSMPPMASGYVASPIDLSSYIFSPMDTTAMEALMKDSWSSDSIQISGLSEWGS